MHDPAHSHGDLHTHGPGVGESTAAASSMMFIILAIVAALVLTGLVFAWSPWNDGNRVTPGQGGEDREPAPERQIPDRPQQQLPQQQPR